MAPGGSALFGRVLFFWFRLVYYKEQKGDVLGLESGSLQHLLARQTP